MNDIIRLSARAAGIKVRRLGSTDLVLARFADRLRDVGLIRDSRSPAERRRGRRIGRVARLMAKCMACGRQALTHFDSHGPLGNQQFGWGRRSLARGARRSAPPG